MSGACRACQVLLQVSKKGVRMPQTLVYDKAGGRSCPRIVSNRIGTRPRSPTFAYRLRSSPSLEISLPQNLCMSEPSTRVNEDTSPNCQALTTQRCGYRFRQRRQSYRFETFGLRHVDSDKLLTACQNRQIQPVLAQIINSRQEWTHGKNPWLKDA